jgi:hypothetical protein
VQREAVVNVTSLLSSPAAVAAVVAAVVSGAFVGVNGWRQRNSDSKRLALQLDHERRLRELQFEHERRLAWDADRRHLRDMKLDRIRRALTVVIETANDASGVVLGLVHFRSKDRVAEGARLVELMQRLNGQAGVIATDQESEDLAGSVRELIGTANRYRHQLDRLDAGPEVPLNERREKEREDRLRIIYEELEPQMLKQAEAIIPAARQLLLDLEQPVPRDPDLP